MASTKPGLASHSVCSSWAAEIGVELSRSARLGWTVAACASVLMLCEALALASLRPLHRTLKFTIVRDSRTGMVSPPILQSAQNPSLDAGMSLRLHQVPRIVFSDPAFGQAVSRCLRNEALAPGNYKITFRVAGDGALLGAPIVTTPGLPYMAEINTRVADQLVQAALQCAPYRALRGTEVVLVRVS